MQLHIIYTESDMLLSKRSYASWHDIQDEFSEYKASLGPWDHEETIAFLHDEYSDLSPSAQVQVIAFMSAPDESISLLFHAHSPSS